MTHVLQVFILLYMDHQSTASFEHFFFFFKLFLLMRSISFCWNSWIFCHLLHTCWLTCFRESWGNFLCIFGHCKSWLLCHVPHVSRIITSGIIFAEIPFAVSKEWVRFWPHVSLVTNVKMFLKSPSKNNEEKEKEKSFLCYTQMQ